MDITIQPLKLHGSVAAISSKSQAHRLLICSAIADGETILICPETNRDIEATAECLQALGADIRRMDGYYRIFPIQKVPETAVLNCCESGSTLRFMLPIAGALGVDALFKLEGRLPCRPLSPLWEEMQRMGCSLSRPTENTVRCQGKLHAGTYSIDGGVSSQFITGLLFALSLIEGESTLQITGKTESKPYIEMTRAAIWYARNGKITDSDLCGIKALRCLHGSERGPVRSARHRPYSGPCLPGGCRRG